LLIFLFGGLLLGFSLWACSPPSSPSPSSIFLSSISLYFYFRQIWTRILVSTSENLPKNSNWTSGWWTNWPG
jgi:hypothetical protein